jgi:hypothetical protein
MFQPRCVPRLFRWVKAIGHRLRQQQPRILHLLYGRVAVVVNAPSVAPAAKSKFTETLSFDDTLHEAMRELLLVYA